MRACRAFLSPHARHSPSRHFPSPHHSSSSLPPICLSLPLLTSTHQRSLCPPLYIFTPTRTAFFEKGAKDWKCGNCNKINFSYRWECTKCSLPRDETNAVIYEDYVQDEDVPKLLQEILSEKFPLEIAENRLCSLMAYPWIPLDAAQKLYKRANSYSLPKASRFYKRAAKTFARLGAIHDLVEVARDVGTGSNAGYVLAILAAELLFSNKFEDAVTVLKKMSAYNLKVEKKRLAHIYNEAKKIPGGLQKIRDLNLSFSDNAMLTGMIVESQISKKNILDINNLLSALDLFEKSAPQLDVVVASQLLNLAVEGYESTVKEPEKETYRKCAMRILDVVAQHMAEFKADAMWYSQVVSAMAKLGATEQIKPLWDSIKHNKEYISFRACFNIAFNLPLPDLEECVWEMIEVLNESNFLELQFFEMVVAKFAAVGKLETASNLINKMTAYNFFPDNRFVSSYLAALATPGTQEAVEGADTSMRNLATQGFVFTSRVYESIMFGFINLKQLHKAVDVLLFAFENETDSRGIDPYLYTYLLELLIEQKEKDLVLKLYQGVQKSGEKISPNLEREVFAMHPELSKIEEDFEKVISKAPQISDEISTQNLPGEIPVPNEAEDTKSKVVHLSDDVIQQRLAKKLQKLVANPAAPGEQATTHQNSYSQNRPLPDYVFMHPADLIKHLIPPGATYQLALPLYPPHLQMPPNQETNLQIPQPQFSNLQMPPEQVSNLQNQPNLYISPEQLQNEQLPPADPNLQVPNLQFPNQAFEIHQPPPSLKIPDLQPTTDLQPPTEQTQDTGLQVPDLQISNFGQQPELQPDLQQTLPSPNLQPPSLQPPSLQQQSPNLRSPKNPSKTKKQKTQNEKQNKQKQKQNQNQNEASPQTTNSGELSISKITQLPLTIKKIRQKNSKKIVTVVDLGKMRLFDENDFLEFEQKTERLNSYLSHLKTLEKQQKIEQQTEHSQKGEQTTESEQTTDSEPKMTEIGQQNEEITEQQAQIEIQEVTQQNEIPRNAQQLSQAENNEQIQQQIEEKEKEKENEQLHKSQFPPTRVKSPSQRSKRSQPKKQQN